MLPHYFHPSLVMVFVRESDMLLHLKAIGVMLEQVCRYVGLMSDIEAVV